MSNYNDNTGASGWASYIRSYSNPGSDYSSILTFGTSPASLGGPSERMRIAANGNVGIGTTIVAATFHVVGQSFLNNVVANTAKNQLTINVNGSNYAQFYDIGVSATNALAIGGSTGITAVPSAPIMTWALSSGNVGIGTSSPTAKLQIGTQTYATAPDATYFVAGNNDFSGPGPVGAISGYPTTANRFQVTASIFDVVGGWETVNGSHALLRASAYNVINSTPAFIVLNDGNVGIGTNSPANSLTIISPIGTTFGNVAAVNSNVPIYAKVYGGNTASTRNIFVGHVYTGDNTAYSDLQINLVNANNSSAQAASFVLTQDGSIALRNGTVASTDSLVGTEKMRITSGGNVGIGTTSPVAKLDVAGDSKLGSSISNVHQITGSLSITGSVTGISTESFHPFLLG
jgi:hypothetical protein